MIKIVVEFSEDYVHERADVNNLTKLIEQKESNPLALMVGHLVFSSLEKKMKEQSEFFISSRDLTDLGDLELFNDSVTYLCGILLGKKD